MLQDIVIGQAPNKMYSSYYPVKDKEGITPQTRAIFFCMLATGVQKLFTYNDCREFIFRLAVMFKQLDVIDNFFRDDFLFSFKFEEKYFRISTDDLLAHIGLHTTHYPDAAMPLDEWYEKMEKLWQLGIWTSIAGGAINPLAHLVFEETSGDTVNVKMKSLDVQIPHNHKNNAKILATNVMKDMPRKPFDQFYEEERETLQKMEEYLNFIKSPLPIRYDWDSLPEENQQAILKHLVDEDFYREGMTMEDAIEEYAEWIPDLVYLAWINANGLAGDLYFSEIDPRVDFDLSRYSELGVDDGINLGVTYDTFDLYTIEEYLVDPLNKNKKVS